MSMSFKVNTRKEEGFTLIEVVIAIAILAIILASVINYFINSTAITSASKDRREALQLARSVIEDMKSSIYNDSYGDNFTERLNSRESDFNNGDWKNEEDFFDFKDDYGCKVVVNNYESYSDLKEITVRVEWDDENSIELKTLITKR